MRLFFMGLIALCLASCSAETTTAPPSAPPSGSNEIATSSRLAAVLIYADWCSSCKIIDPKIQTARGEGAIDGVSFVQLDYTARNEETFFAQADELGIGEAIRAQLANDVITGILLLVDIDDKKVVDDLRKELSPAQLRTRIENAAATA